MCTHIYYLSFYTWLFLITCCIPVKAHFTLPPSSYFCWLFKHMFALRISNHIFMMLFSYVRSNGRSWVWSIGWRSCPIIIAEERGTIMMMITEVVRDSVSVYFVDEFLRMQWRAVDLLRLIMTYFQLLKLLLGSCLLTSQYLKQKLEVEWFMST
jgi:hypothetical protein